MKRDPLCKNCGKPVPKLLVHYSFTPATLNKRQNGERSDSGHTIYLDEDQRPRSREEAQRYVNAPIISISKFGHETICSMRTWDGESYEWGGHFHSQTCAARFGLGMARNFPTYATDEYREAMAARGVAA